MKTNMFSEMQGPATVVRWAGDLTTLPFARSACTSRGSANFLIFSPAFRLGFCAAIDEAKKYAKIQLSRMNFKFWLMTPKL
jgi:hypothetical protein